MLMKKQKGNFLRKTVAMLLAAALVLGLVPGASPLSVQAAETGSDEQGEDRAARTAQPHVYDMSVECGNDDPLEFSPLTSV